MKKTLHLVACRLLMLAVLLSCLPLAVWGQGTQPQGDGQQATPYKITTHDELLWVADQVNNQNKTFEDEYIVLGNDITLEDKLNEALIGVRNKSFNGSFDGQGYVIKNVDSENNVQVVALFETVEEKCIIQNLGIEICKSGMDITTGSNTVNIGILCGLSQGVIRNCYVTGGDITIHSVAFPTAYVGSLVCWSTGGSVENCYSTVNISFDGNPRYVYLGGLLGLTTVPCLNCYYTGNITVKAENEWQIGGLVGLLGGQDMTTIKIKNSLVYGNITIQATERYTDSMEGKIWGKQNKDDEAINCENNYAACNIQLQTTIAEINPSDVYVGQNGEEWNDKSAIPTGLFTGNSWDISADGLMPRLKMYGKDEFFPSQPTIRISDRKRVYEVKKAIIGHGSVNSPTEWFSKGENVALTVTPESDYETDAITVTDASGNIISLSGSGTDYSFEMPADHVTVSATFKEQKKPDPTPDPDPTPTPDPTPDPDPTPVYYKVTLPEIEGLISDPVADEYLVEAWSSFRFYLTLQEGYEASVPLVMTDRSETLSPRTSDGAYIVKYVRQPVNISIDGIKPNTPPVANTEIKTNKVEVKAENGVLTISTPEPMKVRIYTFSGSICKDLGEVNGNVRVPLPTGPYIVVADGYSLKVIL